ncbi:MAG: beta-aspartyl-peptidase [Aequorivita sp.]|nr:beta-aspartyl-peptidase [Aequorivita sp.]|tara:strand:+ start:33335 stop:34408 length:1074 start_codon:yes stop_codon:yes gene_type:complete
MRNLTFLVILFLLISCNNDKNNHSSIKNIDQVHAENANNYGIVIHGGAGTILKEYLNDSLENAYKTKLKEAVLAGNEILKNGGTAIDAVTNAINILENSPLFNAGKGAVFTNKGTIELDASIMDGKNLNAGAVAGVRKIKNPINLAKDVMLKSEHVMLYGDGAETFAQHLNYKMMDTSYFYTKKRYESLQRVLKKEKEKTKASMSFQDSYIKDAKFGTVGCVALDKQGNLAAGTSTGGMTNKRFNRIGDSPIIGAGTYANNATCAVSATGWGEFFIRSVVAYDISALMEYKGLSLQDAAKEVIHNKVPALGGDGGIIAIDKDGNIAMEFNTAGMYRASMNAKGELTIGIYSENEINQ